MSKSQPHIKNHQQITPPQSFVTSPLTPPSTDKKAFTQVSQVIALFKNWEARGDIEKCSWVVFQLAKGDYREIERQLGHDEDLLRFVNNKIRYDYFAESHRLAIRMPAGVHEYFIDKVEDEIRNQLKQIRSGSDNAAIFAQKINCSRSTTIHFPLSSESRHDPDTSFKHDNARYPGVIVEVGYSQKRKSLGRLAENYLLDSNANIQVVVCLDIEYGKDKGALRKATLSVWRTHQVPVADGQELRVFQEIADEAFRDVQGNPTDHLGLRLQLVDFGPKSLTQGVGDREISISTRQLCEYLANAEREMQGQDNSIEDTLLPGVKKRQRSATPPEEITSDVEAWYVEQEERAAKRAEVDDDDYEVTETTSSSG